MYVIEVKTGDKHEVDVKRLESQDFKGLTKKKYFFDWKKEKRFEVYKISLKHRAEILGLVSFERIPEEWRIHIRLLTVSVDNKGRNKIYDRIADVLLTFVSRQAVKDFAELACVSLKPKGAIAQHYIETYDMNVTGATLSLEITEIMNLIEKFDNDKK